MVKTKFSVKQRRENEAGGWRSEVGGRKSEVGSQRSEVGSWMLSVGGRQPGAPKACLNLTSDFQKGGNMKEITITVIIIIIVCTASFIMQRYLIQTSDEMVGKLENLKQEIKEAQKNGNNENAKEISEEVKEKWEEIHRQWSMVVLHEELDMIELSLIEVNAGVEIGAYEDSLQEIDRSIFLVGHIQEKEAFKLKNIF